MGEAMVKSIVTEVWKENIAIVIIANVNMVMERIAKVTKDVKDTDDLLFLLLILFSSLLFCYFVDKRKYINLIFIFVNVKFCGSINQPIFVIFAQTQ